MEILRALWLKILVAISVQAVFVASSVSPCSDETNDDFANIFVFGSSVAMGVGATNFQGYAYMLGKEVETRFGQKLNNQAVGGYDTVQTLELLEEVLGGLDYSPQVVIIGVSLANQGLPRATNPEEARAVRNEFETGVEVLVNTTLDFGVETVIVGTVYPENEYNSMTYPVLRQVFEKSFFRLPELGNRDQVVVADLLTDLDNGRGHWKSWTFKDAGHPNNAGHELMFASLNKTFYGSVDLDSFEKASHPSCGGSRPSRRSGSRSSTNPSAIGSSSSASSRSACGYLQAFSLIIIVNTLVCSMNTGRMRVL